jgi:hypothetical protein
MAESWQYWDAPNTTVVQKQAAIPPLDYRGLVNMPISPEEQMQATDTSWWNYFTNMKSKVGETIGITTDPNKAVAEGGLLSTPAITGIVKSTLGMETSEAETKAVAKIGSVSDMWQAWGNEAIARVVLAVLALIVIYLALRKMV